MLKILSALSDNEQSNSYAALDYQPVNNVARCLNIICANSLFMDRKITRIERLKLNRKRIIISSCVLILLIGAGIYVWKGIAPSVHESELGFAVVDTGDIEISVGGTGV